MRSSRIEQLAGERAIKVAIGLHSSPVSFAEVLFVLLDSPFLDLDPDAGVFAEHFQDCPPGGGVAWLHVRLDDRPKYDGFAPYRSAGTTDRSFGGR